MKGGKTENVNDHSFQVKLLNLVFCAMLISGFLQKCKANGRFI